MRPLVRRSLPWALLLALCAGLWIGWVVLRRTVEEWAFQEHRVGAWSVRVFGGRLSSWRLALADSVRIEGPGARALVSDLRLGWVARDGAPVHRFPVHLLLSARRVAMTLLPAPPSTAPKGAPAFPASMRLPVSFEVSLDTLQLVRDSTIDLLARGIHLASTGASSVAGRWGDLRMRRIPAWTSGSVGLDWGVDSLRGSMRLALSSGCCARDSLTLSVATPFRDVTTGRAALRADIAAAAGWNELLPGIVHAPQIDDVHLEVDATRRDGAVPSVRLRLGFDLGPFVYFPPLRWNVEASMDSSGTKVAADAEGESGQKLSARLAAPGRIDSAIVADRFSGTLDVVGIGFTIAGYPHPFDGTVDVRRIGLRGGEGVVHLASGSVVEGGATWKGLHWHADAKIAPGEPWAVDWVPGIRIADGARIRGRDTVGAALFHVLAAHPGFRKIDADSMEVSIRLDLNHIVFPEIRLWGKGQRWNGDGKVDWRACGYAFSLRPDSASASAGVEGDFEGRVRAELEDFPVQDLPVDDPRARLPYPVFASGRFERLPATRTDSASMSLSAHLRARPAADSLDVVLEAAQRGNVAEVSSLRLTLGTGRIDAGARAVRDDSAGWVPSGLRADFSGVELERGASIWPGLPILRGKIEGNLAIERDQGVSAQARVVGLSLQGKDGWTDLPDLVVWGLHDTLHVGGRWPVGKEYDPFRLTLTGLFQQKLSFDLLAFHGDVVRLKGHGVLENRTRLHADIKAEGGIGIPGTEARLEDLLVEGEIRGERKPDGFAWSASLEGRDGILRALKGLPLRSRFLVRAEPGTIFIDSASLRGEKAGNLSFRGRYAMESKLFTGEGHARDFHLELGEGKRFRLGSMDLVAGADQRLRASLADLSWQQVWKGNEGLWVDVDKADLVLVQAQDWRKLQGQAQVRKLLFTRNIADIGSLTKTAIGKVGRAEDESSGPKTESVPLLLDIRAFGGGDSIRIDNNLAHASLSFDLQATGPVEALLLNGTVDGNPDGSNFGYGGKTFALDEFHMEWNVAPPLGGRYALEGSRSILQACPDAATSSTMLETSTSDSCSLKLSSEGTLSEPRMHPLTTDCGAGGADEGAVQAALALARDCYPENPSNGTSTIGGNAKSAAIDIGVQQGMGYVNDAIRQQLERQRREGRVFLPDSLALTDVPIGGTRDQLGLLAVYRLSDDMDAEGEYQHTFARTATATSGTTVLADDYSLRLRWRPPLEWIQERRIQERLRDHLVFQVELGQGLDSRSQRETTIRPSLRYRWEFW